MGSKREVSQTDRGQIIALRQMGVRVGRVAERYDVTIRTVQRICRRHALSGNKSRLPRSGRRRKTAAREDRRLFRMSRLSRFATRQQLADQWSDFLQLPMSKFTTKRRLKSARIFSRVAKRKPLIGQQNRTKRVVFATRIRNWTAEHWSRIVFSDESRFDLSFGDGRVRCWRTNGEAYNPETFNFRSRSNTSVMLWGCVSIHGPGNLVVVDGNMDQWRYIDTLEENLLPSVEAMFGDAQMPFIFQDDNAPCHRARTVNAWIDRKEIQRMMWPAQTPDGNLIENLWDDLTRAVIRDRPTTREDLIQSLFRAWGQITPQRIRGLYDSMPRRMGAIITARGYASKY